MKNFRLPRLSTRSMTTAAAFSASSVHDFTLNSIDGKATPLASYKGKVLLLVNGEVPLGRRNLWPIYAAAERHGLPIGIHAGSVYRHPVTPVGWPSYYVEDYVAQSCAFENQFVSSIPLLTRNPLLLVTMTAGAIGTAKRIDDAVGRYIEFVKASFPKGMRLDGLRIVLDCANGATYKVGPYPLDELGAEVIPLGTAPDGLNINQHVGSV